MLHRPRNNRRAGALRAGAMALEAALVQPVMLFLLLALVVGGMGVFRYQQVACQVREAARYAAVRGSDWQKNTGQASPTQDEIYQQAVAPFLSGMDAQGLTFQVLWIDQSTGLAVPWDKARKDPQTLTKTGDYVTNTVRVTVTYQFSPAIFFLGSIQLTSTSEFPMAS
jgi:Flp pilus assembly protein TadG